MASPLFTLDPEVRIKRGDTLPDFVAALSERDPDALDGNSRRPLNLSLIESVKLIARTRNNKRSIGGACTVDAVDPDDPIWALYPLITPHEYKVRYAWQTADTNLVGTYNAEIELTFVGGAKQTVPARGYFRIVIEEDQG